jgi:phosphoribosyl-ATP pyrophosphohydrolase/phosphoribosyl-AMP cyclohydrolase
MNNCEEIKYNADGLICAIAQDVESGEVLMQAYMNETALHKTLDTGYAHYYSRSRKALWKKGETSGHLQQVMSVVFDCDKDCVLLKIKQIGVACHTGSYSCFFNEVKVFEDKIGAEMLGKLYRIIEDRKNNPIDGSYTNYLFEKGIDKIAKKTGEEAVELVIAAKNNDKTEITSEAADLIYHTLVLLKNADIKLSDVFTELKSRHN